MKKGKLLGIKNIGISVVGDFIAVKIFYLHVFAFMGWLQDFKHSFGEGLYMLKVLEARGELELAALKKRIYVSYIRFLWFSFYLRVYNNTNHTLFCAKSYE